MEKKSAIIFILLSIIFLSLIYPGAAFSGDISIGMAAWYAQWDPMFKKAVSHEDAPDTRDNRFSMDKSRAMLLGPILSFNISEDWNLSGLFIFYCTNYNASGHYYEINDTGDEVIIDNNIEIKRNDYDIALNYSITRYFKIFFGIKQQKFNIDGTYLLNNLTGGSYEPGVINVDLEGRGPGAGLGITIPLTDSYFLIWNLSGIYMNFDYSESSGGDRNSADYTARGANTNLSVAKYLADSSTTLMLGIRYQFLKYKYESGSKKEFDNETDRFYGITFSIVKTFDTSTDKEGTTTGAK